MMRNRQSSEEIDPNSVYEARWLLAPIFALALIIAVIGILG